MTFTAAQTTAFLVIVVSSRLDKQEERGKGVRYLGRDLRDVLSNEGKRDEVPQGISRTPCTRR